MRSSATDAPQPRTAPGPRRFRADINALRALAVATVVLFHFRVPPFTGGFIGVDVFFVISGFLMSQIIAGRIGSGTFSILGFYYDRVRRIVPALLVLCATLLVLSVTVLDPLTAATTARNTLFALLFVSNIPFALEDGYFTNSSDANWLLHTWTLSVEWQFYLIFPLLVLALSRVPWIWRRRFFLCLAATLVLLVATVLLSGPSNVTLQLGFFLLPTRAWELLAGACVTFAPRIAWAASWRTMLQVAGLGLIAVSTVLLDSGFAWPSVWTVLPVAGAAAVLVADASPGRWLEAAPVQSIGRWSYSIYLWHWPLVVALRYFGWGQGLAAVGTAMILSVAMGGLSYAMAEVRLRDVLFPPRPATYWSRRLGFAWAAWALAAAVCLAAWQTGGLETVRTARLDPELRAGLLDLKSATRDWVGEAPCRTSTRLSVGHVCQIGTAGAEDVAVIGDSHVLQILARYGAPGRIGSGQGATFLYRNGCPPIPDLELIAPGQNCAAFLDAASTYLEQRHFRRIVFVSAWNVYFDDDGIANANSFACLRDRTTGACPVPATTVAYRAAAEAAFRGLGHFMQRLREAGSEVAVVGVEPILDGQTASSFYRESFLSGALVRAQPIDEPAFEARHALVEEGVREAAEVGGARLIRPSDFLCRSALCPVYDGDSFIYRDGNHVRASIIARRRYDYLDSVILGD